MADKKISALTSATTPLAGTEVLPVVQSGSTVKVAVSDLTAGRAVSALSVTATTLQATNLKAADGTAAATIDNTTGKINVSSELSVDNINISGNTISSTNSNGNVVLAPNGTGATQLGSLNGFNTSTPATVMSLASSYKTDGSSGSSFDVYFPIMCMPVKSASGGNLTSASSNATGVLTLAAGTDISLMNVGYTYSAASTNAQRQSAPIKLAPTGYSIAMRIVGIGRADYTGDAELSALLLRHSIDNGSTWTNWEFMDGYYHGYWSQQTWFCSPWTALRSTQDTVSTVLQFGVRSASAYGLAYSSLVVEVAYVKL